MEATIDYTEAEVLHFNVRTKPRQYSMGFVSEARNTYLVFEGVGHTPGEAAIELEKQVRKSLDCVFTLRFKREEQADLITEIDLERK